MLFITLSFLVNPAYTYACHNVQHKETSEKEESSCSKKCCEKKNTKEEKHTCDGKCHHSGCNTSTFPNIILHSNEFDLQNDVFNFALKNTFSYYQEVTLSSGFTSIWLKPKIQSLYC
jgi:hypothetical protein